jgi:hypothetical protein
MQDSKKRTGRDDGKKKTGGKRQESEEEEEEEEALGSGEDGSEKSQVVRYPAEKLRIKVFNKRITGIAFTPGEMSKYVAVSLGIGRICMCLYDGC